MLPTFSAVFWCFLMKIKILFICEAFVTSATLEFNTFMETPAEINTKELPKLETKW